MHRRRARSSRVDRLGIARPAQSVTRMGAGRSSDLRARIAGLLTDPIPHRMDRQWRGMGLPSGLDHSGGAVPDLHRIPCSPDPADCRSGHQHHVTSRIVRLDSPPCQGPGPESCRDAGRLTVCTELRRLCAGMSGSPLSRLCQFTGCRACARASVPTFRARLNRLTRHAHADASVAPRSDGLLPTLSALTQFPVSSLTSRSAW